MGKALQGWSRPLRAGALVALVGAVAALVMAQWVRQADAARENERLYEQCLSQAQDVAHVKGCTADFYTRWDGRLGTTDATALALESQRLVELRTTAADVTTPGADAPAPATAPSAPSAPASTAPPPAAAVVGPAEAAPANEAQEEEAAHEDDEGTAANPTPAPQDDDEPSTHPTQGTPVTRTSTPRPRDPRPATQPDVAPGAKVATKPEKATTGSVPDTDATDAVDDTGLTG